MLYYENAIKPAKHLRSMVNLGTGSWNSKLPVRIANVVDSLGTQTNVVYDVDTLIFTSR